MLLVDNGILALDYYYPTKRNGEWNPDYGESSRMILRFKDRNNADIITFCNRIIERIDLRNVNLLAVPSSTAGNVDNAVHMLCSKLSASCVNVIYHRGWLRRTKSVSPAHLGGPRSIQVHLESISINPPTTEGSSVHTNTFIVIDDVYTTGSSMKACMKIVCNAYPGAMVLGLCLARTKDYFDTKQPATVNTGAKLAPSSYAVQCSGIASKLATSATTQEEDIFTGDGAPPPTEEDMPLDPEKFERLTM